MRLYVLLFSTTVTNTVAKINWQENGLFGLLFHGQLLEKSRAGIQGRNLGAGTKAKPWKSAVYWFALQASIHLPFSNIS